MQSQINASQALQTETRGWERSRWSLIDGCSSTYETAMDEIYVIRYRQKPLRYYPRQSWYLGYGMMARSRPCISPMFQLLILIIRWRPEQQFENWTLDPIWLPLMLRWSLNRTPKIKLSCWPLIRKREIERWSMCLRNTTTAQTQILHYQIRTVTNRNEELKP